MVVWSKSLEEFKGNRLRGIIHAGFGEGYPVRFRLVEVVVTVVSVG